MARASSSLAETLYATLRESILAGAFDPGEPLDEVEVARSLGTSRTPAREALRKLEAEGLVDKVPHRGTFVARLIPAEVDDIREVRMLLEAFAARRAAKRIPPAVLAGLRADLGGVPAPRCLERRAGGHPNRGKGDLRRSDTLSGRRGPLSG